MIIVIRSVSEQLSRSSSQVSNSGHNGQPEEAREPTSTTSTTRPTGDERDIFDDQTPVEGKWGRVLGFVGGRRMGELCYTRTRVIRVICS